jgi:hypothetical protein
MEGMVPGATGGATPGAVPSTGTGSTQFGADATDVLGQSAIQGALVPNPGGTIIYWRME